MLRGVRLISMLGFSGLWACAPIAHQWAQQTDPHLSYAKVVDNPSAYTGAFILWGGTIQGNQPIPGGTELMVEEAPLSPRERPDLQITQGMFIAKISEYLNPDTFGQGRVVTLAGQLIGEEKRTVGVEEYTFPVVAIRQIHLWKEKIVVRPQHAYGLNWGGLDRSVPFQGEWREADETGRGEYTLPGEPEEMP